MKRKQVFLWIQTLLVVLICVLLVSAAIRIYREGMLARAADVTAWIYTREIVLEALGKILVVIIGTVIFVIIGQVAGRGNTDTEDTRKTDDSSRADSSRADSSRADSSRTDGSRTDGSRTDSSRTAIRDKTVERKADGMAASVKERQEWYSSGAAKPTRRNRMIRIALILLAAGCIIFGIMNDSARDVLIKAAAVCTECIGLG